MKTVSPIMAPGLLNERGPLIYLLQCLVLLLLMARHVEKDTREFHV